MTGISTVAGAHLSRWIVVLLVFTVSGERESSHQSCCLYTMHHRINALFVVAAEDTETLVDSV
jgi:hypothetical protein